MTRRHLLSDFNALPIRDLENNEFIRNFIPEVPAGNSDYLFPHGIMTYNILIPIS